MKKWLHAAAVRAVRTTAQTAVALIPTTAVAVESVDWPIVASGAVLAGILSLLTSVATGLPEEPKPWGPPTPPAAE